MDDNSNTQDIRIAVLTAAVEELKLKTNKLESENATLRVTVTELEVGQARTAERVTLWAGAQMFVSLALSAIAAYIGSM